jgi:SsrA-binding protein
VIENKNARRNYEISDRVTAGVVLTGAEVKTLRAGRGSLRDAHAKFVDGELHLIGADIPQYSHFAGKEYDAKRSRKLLLNKTELLHLSKKLEGKPLTLVPLKLFFKGRWVKCDLGVGKGKKEYEKREDIKKRESEREMARALKR